MTNGIDVNVSLRRQGRRIRRAKENSIGSIFCALARHLAPSPVVRPTTCSSIQQRTRAPNSKTRINGNARAWATKQTGFDPAARVTASAPPPARASAKGRVDSRRGRWCGARCSWWRYRRKRRKRSGDRRWLREGCSVQSDAMTKLGSKSMRINNGHSRTPLSRSRTGLIGSERLKLVLPGEDTRSSSPKPTDRLV